MNEDRQRWERSSRRISCDEILPMNSVRQDPLDEYRTTPLLWRIFAWLLFLIRRAYTSRRQLRSRVIFCMSLTWLSTWRGHDMSSASIATASTSRKSILACWPARGDKPVSLIDPLSQSRSLSLLVPIYEPFCCLHGRGIYWRVSG